MKFNKWTYGLAAVGAVSLVSAARADETKMSQLNTALSGTTISGYVDVAAQFNNGNQLAGNQANSVFSALNKTDAFSVNSVTITLDKPMDESAWASGYHVDLNAGTDRIDAFGNTSSTESHFAIRQAYIALRTPLGNGIDWKFGAFDTIIGYESSTGYANPNYTRSFGYGIEATSFVGLLGTYKVSDFLTVNAGIANPNNVYNYDTTVATASLSSKSFLASAVLTAPESFGVFKGATLTLGTVQTFESGGVNNYYAGLTLPTPIKALAVGVAVDAKQSLGDTTGGSGYTFGFYGTYQATDKLGLALRAEYVDTSSGVVGNSDGNGEEITATLSYNLWANVISRVEARWDHLDHGLTGTGGTTGSGYENNVLLALNVIYKF